MLSLVAQAALRAPAKVSKRAFVKAPSQTAHPRSLSHVYLNSSKSLQSRNYKLSSKLFDNASNASNAAKDVPDMADPENFDFSVLQPKSRNTAATNAPRKASTRKYTAEQKTRSTSALKKLQSRVLASKDENPGDNQSIVDTSAAGKDLEVADMWTMTQSAPFVVSLNAYCSILISLSRLENEGIAVEMLPVIADLYSSKRTPTALMHLILMEHWTKIRDYPKARREFVSFIEVANAQFEDLQEKHDDLVDSGRTVPDNLKGPLHNVFEGCSFDSMEDLVDSLRYYVLTVSSSEGTAGPLSRKRTIEAMVRQWNSTELGKLAPIASTDELLENEKKISERFLTL